MKFKKKKKEIHVKNDRILELYLILIAMGIKLNKPSVDIQLDGFNEALHNMQ